MGPLPKGKIEFRCDDGALTEGFRWAKAQALRYAHEGDAVGDWCEASLPGRAAFCMRDISHQLSGAHYLDLDSHNKNMLLRFAQGIDARRDYCSFWEITRDNVPAPVDYQSDADFWYNLPANFDVLDACWRAYKLTGDSAYIEDPDFCRFYDLTVDEYVRRWDHDGDGIPDRAEPGSRRGIPSYDEQRGMERAAVAADLIAAQIRGYRAYADLARLRGREAARCQREADRLAWLLNDQWWDARTGRFFGARMLDGTFASSLGSAHLLAYFDAVEAEDKRSALLNQLHEEAQGGIIVEIMSHYPEIFYRNGQRERGEYWLRRCIDPRLARREYPEVSFCTVGAFVEGMMGLSADAERGWVGTVNRLPRSVGRAELRGCPLFGGTIDLSYAGSAAHLANHTGRRIQWNGVWLEDGESR